VKGHLRTNRNPHRPQPYGRAEGKVRHVPVNGAEGCSGLSRRQLAGHDGSLGSCGVGMARRLADVQVEEVLTGDLVAVRAALPTRMPVPGRMSIWAPRGGYG
jgi:hypothetical protein